MPTQELAEVIARADRAINDEDFDALMAFYADDATLVVMPGRNVTGLDAIRKAFVAIAEHFDHTLHVSQRELTVVEGGDTALVLARTHVAATPKGGPPHDVERRATYVFRRAGAAGWRCVVDNSYGTELLSAAARRRVELSHPIRDGMVTYPGLPGPEIRDHLTREASRARYAPGTEFHIGRISMVANTGTYLDTPAHRFAEGADLAATPLESMTDLDGVVLHAAGGARAIDREQFLPLQVRGRAVLIHTGWDRHFGTDGYAKDAPFLTRRAAEWLAQERAALVGIDSINVDDMGDGTRPAHTLLLAAGIPVVEHLRGLDQLPPTGFRFHAAPPRVHGMGTFPVRAYAVIGA